MSLVFGFGPGKRAVTVMRRKMSRSSFAVKDLPRRGIIGGAPGVGGLNNMVGVRERVRVKLRVGDGGREG